MKPASTVVTLLLAASLAACSLAANPKSDALAACSSYVSAGIGDSVTSAASREARLEAAVSKSQSAAREDKTWQPMSKAMQAVKNVEAQGKFSPHVSIDDASLLSVVNEACQPAGSKP